MFKIEKTILENGLKIMFVSMKETKATTIFAMVGVGSRYENERVNGLAHFSEHMFYKGTEKLKDGFEVMRALDSLGADFNAYTSDEETAFHISVSGEKLLPAAEILYDILVNSKFDSAEIEREKGVILEEINMVSDNPMIYISVLAQKLFFGETSLGRPTVGNKENIRALKRDDFVNFHANYYRPNNIILVVAGALHDKEKLMAQIKNTFGKMSLGKNEKYQSYKAEQNSPAISVHPRQIDQTHLIFGYRGISRIDENRPTLKVLNAILGGMSSSRLFVEIRERRGLAYYVRSDFWDFQDTGMLVAGAGVRTDKTEEAVKVIRDQFQLFANKTVSDEELERAKTNLVSHVYLGLESSEEVASFVAERETFWGKTKKIEEIVREIKKVSKEDIQKFSKELFVRNHLNLVILGPQKDSKKFEKIIGG